MLVDSERYVQQHLRLKVLNMPMVIHCKGCNPDCKCERLLASIGSDTHTTALIVRASNAVDQKKLRCDNRGKPLGYRYVKQSVSHTEKQQ